MARRVAWFFDSASNVRHERHDPACRGMSARWRGWAPAKRTARLPTRDEVCTAGTGRNNTMTGGACSDRTQCATLQRTAMSLQRAMNQQAHTLQGNRQDQTRRGRTATEPASNPATLTKNTDEGRCR